MANKVLLRYFIYFSLQPYTSNSPTVKGCLIFHRLRRRMSKSFKLITGIFRKRNLKIIKISKFLTKLELKSTKPHNVKNYIFWIF